MLRFLLTTLAAATIGSFTATAVGCLLLGGTGAPSPLGFIVGIAAMSMIFTIPGAVILIGTQARLYERRLSSRMVDALLVVIGMLTGAGVLAPLGGLHAAILGVGYGGASALALLLVQWASRLRAGNA